MSNIEDKEQFNIQKEKPIDMETAASACETTNPDAELEPVEEKEAKPIAVDPKIAKKTSIGGQALIEGLMMLGPHKKAVALRKPSGEIDLTVKDRNEKSQKFNVPFLRGIVRLVSQLKTGISALTHSAEMVELEEEGEEEKETSKVDKFLEKHQGFVMGLTLFISLFLAIALFVFLPSLITDLIRRFSGLGADGGRSAVFLLSLIEGVVRIAIFLIYMWSVSKMKEIKRVWQYHGAEHKTIACYEAGLPLTVENCRWQSRLHPRCGTAFLFIFMIVSILLFALVGRYSAWVNLLIRLALVPLVAGITYEITRYVGRSDSKLSRALSKPGLALQRLTTAEPDDSMLEVAICAMEAVIPEVEGEDDW